MPNMLPLTRVRDLTSLGKSTIYRLISEGRFPKPIRLTARRVAWSEEALRQWIDQRNGHNG